MQITFDISNPDEVKLVYKLFQAITAKSESVQASAPVAPAEAADDVAIPTPSGRLRGRPPKPKTPQPSGPPVEDTGIPFPADEDVRPVSIDDVRAALQKFTAARGVPDGVALLREFGAARISELSVDVYREFVSRCAL